LSSSTSDSTFEALLAELAEQSLPPVHSWQPERSGRIDIRIRTDGRWFHEGVEIKRQGLVKVLASVLRRDDDGYCLVTPAERLLIEVDDAPFIAGGMEVRGAGAAHQELLFTTNIGELVVADETRPIVVTYNNPADPEEPRPYIDVRDNTPALIGRNVFYQLVELGETRDDGRFIVRSRSAEFELGRL